MNSDYRIVMYSSLYNKGIYNLYNNLTKEDDFFKPLSYEEYNELVFYNKDFNNKLSFVALLDNQVIGFASAVTKDSNKNMQTCFLHTIIVDKCYRRKGIGTLLLNRIEEVSKSINITTIRFVFLSGINYPWNVPGYKNHMHPGMPCVRINSPFYIFLYHHNFFVNGIHEGFHVDLSTYKMPENVELIKEKCQTYGLSVELYDPSTHKGIEKFCEEINNPGFASSIMNNLNKDNPYPFLVAIDSGRVVGWTGAIYVEQSKRGHLDGICVHPDYQGKGLGQLLFSNLCLELKKLGSEYMTLFTGLDNKARYIYLRCGFRVVNSFADMKKELV